MNKDIVNEIKCLLLIGLGRIGLPQALVFASCGVQVYGLNPSPGFADALREGVRPFNEPKLGELLDSCLDKKFIPLASWDSVALVSQEIDAVVFTIGTEVLNVQDADTGKKINFSNYFAILDQLFSSNMSIKQGITLIIRTTLPLGGTDQLKDYIETTYALLEGRDFYLAFVPERMIEGRAIDELMTLPKIIGVYTEAAFEPIRALFQKTGGEIIRVKNPITAEFCKLTDNAFRSTLFSFSNEIALHAKGFDINAGDVIAAVNSNYDRNTIPNPGFVSGYCLSKDPYIFEMDFMKQQKNRDTHSVWYYGRRTNDYLVDFVVNQVVNHLGTTDDPTVTLLGLSFKENVDDFRLSHAIKIMEQLIAKNMKKIAVYDPALNTNQYTRIPAHLLPHIVLQTNRLETRLFTDVSAIIVCDRHEALCALNDAASLSYLLATTRNPCYLFDGCDLWPAAQTVTTIDYEGLGYS